MNRDDGVLNVHCMSTKDYLKFYNEDKYWNVELKDEFVSQTRSLWHKTGNKYDGRIFNQAHEASEDITLSQLKVDKELQEAIKKHGEVVPPKEYEDVFFDKINDKKKDLGKSLSL